MFCVPLFVFVALAMPKLVSGKEEEIATIHPPFVCVDGTKIALSQVCDGIPNCPDSSDEVRKLCHHILCPESMYRCAYGACVKKISRCDGFQDCADGSDEFRCGFKDICTDREIECLESSKCISLGQICNGYVDCADGSDENVTLCNDYPCPAHTYPCSYGGCIHQEVVCDGIEDCVDGSDEIDNICEALNCVGEACNKFTCREDEFTCETGKQCIPRGKVCDGSYQCRDASDEKPEICKKFSCAKGMFRCTYGACIPEQLKCNGQANCYDMSDEDECGFSSSDGDCRLPAAQPGRHYTVSECPYCRPGSLVHKYTKLNFTCDEEQSLHGPKIAYCYNGNWLPSLPHCSAGNGTMTCAPITAPGAEKRCEAKWGPHQGWISCDSPAPVGTLVTLECPDFYQRHSGASHSTCLHDGTWSRIPLTCVPICGVRETSVGPLIVKGWEVPFSDPLPWHATLFSHNDGKWTFFCGGTLIAERLILTAGHCVWKTDPDTIKVGLACYSSNIDDKDENKQIIDVERIEHQTSYQDHEGNYNSDVALLILKTQVEINSFVLPACVDWTNSIDISSRTGEIGLTSGMGLTENDTFSETLRATSMKLISEEKCRQSHARDFRKYLTYTSFCAGWANGTGVCNGDSGGGLVIQKPNTTFWEIHGIISVSPRRLGSTFCDPNYYTIFTKVSVYNNWIKKILETVPILGPRILKKLPNSDTLET